MTKIQLYREHSNDKLALMSLSIVCWRLFNQYASARYFFGSNQILISQNIGCCLFINLFFFLPIKMVTLHTVSLSRIHVMWCRRCDNLSSLSIREISFFSILMLFLWSKPGSYEITCDAYDKKLFYVWGWVY